MRGFTLVDSIWRKWKIEGHQALLSIFSFFSVVWKLKDKLNERRIFSYTRTSPSKVTVCRQQDSDLRDSAVGGRRSSWFLWSLLPAGWIWPGNKSPGMCLFFGVHSSSLTLRLGLAPLWFGVCSLARACKAHWHFIPDVIKLFRIKLLKARLVKLRFKY